MQLARIRTPARLDGGRSGRSGPRQSCQHRRRTLPPTLRMPIAARSTPICFAAVYSLQSQAAEGDRTHRSASSSLSDASSTAARLKRSSGSTGFERPAKRDAPLGAYSTARRSSSSARTVSGGLRKTCSNERLENASADGSMAMLASKAEIAASRSPLVCSVTPDCQRAHRDDCRTQIEVCCEDQPDQVHGSTPDAVGLICNDRSNAAMAAERSPSCRAVVPRAI